MLEQMAVASYQKRLKNHNEHIKQELLFYDPAKNGLFYYYFMLFILFAWT